MELFIFMNFTVHSGTRNFGNIRGCFGRKMVTGKWRGTKKKNELIFAKIHVEMEYLIFFSVSRVSHWPYSFASLEWLPRYFLQHR
jgi:hypothetical protein